MGSWSGRGEKKEMRNLGRERDEEQETRSRTIRTRKTAGRNWLGAEIVPRILLSRTVANRLSYLGLASSLLCRRVCDSQPADLQARKQPTPRGKGGGVAR